MKTNKKNKHVCHQELSRRDFMKGSTAGVTALAVPPIFLELFKETSAHAEGFSPVLPKYRFLHIHFSGGAGIWRWMGGIFASNQAQDITPQMRAAHGLYEDSSTTANLYGTTVLAPTEGATVGQSAFHNAMRAVITPATMARLQLMSAATTSPDDATAQCQYGMMPAIGLAGLKGSLTSAMGLFASPTGNLVGEWVPNGGLEIIPTTRVGNYLNAPAFSNVLGGAGEPIMEEMANVMRKLSAAQINRISQGALPGSTAGAYEEMERNVRSLITPTELNATNNPDLRSIFGIANPIANATLEGTTTESVRIAHMIQGLMAGHTAGIALQDGGYDYHQNVLNATNARDAMAGRLVGQCLQAAAVLSQTNGAGLFLLITQDGGNNGNPAFTPSSDPATTPLFVGDRRDVCSSLVFVMRPNGEGATTLKPFLGSLRANGRVDETTPMGRDRMYSGIVFYSYLRLNGLTDRADAVLKAAGYSALEIAAIKNPANGLFA